MLTLTRAPLLSREMRRGGDFGADVVSTSSTSARESLSAARRRIIPITHLNPAPATGTLRGMIGPVPAGGR